MQQIYVCFVNYAYAALSAEFNYCQVHSKARLTVLDLFQKATQVWDTKSYKSIRADCGGDIVNVADYIIAHQGKGRGSFLCGQSLHNQRIKRLWRDVYNGCTVLYYQLFNYMEDIGILDTESDVHLFCLHYVYLPRINQSLQQFKHYSIVFM